MVNGNGIWPTRFGALPPQCAALNQTNINMQLLTIEIYAKLMKDLEDNNAPRIEQIYTENYKKQMELWK